MPTEKEDCEPNEAEESGSATPSEGASSFDSFRKSDQDLKLRKAYFENLTAKLKDQTILPYDFATQEQTLHGKCIYGADLVREELKDYGDKTIDLPDGTRIFRGSVTGTITADLPDGSALTVMKNGVTELLGAAGTTITLLPEKLVVLEFASGVKITVDVDGTQFFTYPDGTTILKEKSGAIFTAVNGTTIIDRPGQPRRIEFLDGSGNEPPVIRREEDDGDEQKSCVEIDTGGGLSAMPGLPKIQAVLEALRDQVALLIESAKASDGSKVTKLLNAMKAAVPAEPVAPVFPAVQVSPDRTSTNLLAPNEGKDRGVEPVADVGEAGPRKLDVLEKNYPKDEVETNLPADASAGGYVVGSFGAAPVVVPTGRAANDENTGKQGNDRAPRVVEGKFPESNSREVAEPPSKRGCLQLIHNHCPSFVLIASIDKQPEIWHKERDNQGREVYTRKDERGEIEIRDKGGKVLAIKHADNSVTKYEYDKAGKVTAVIAESDSGVRTAVTTFDSSGKVVSEKQFSATDGKLLSVIEVEYEPVGKSNRLEKGSVRAVRTTMFSAEDSRLASSIEIFFNADESKQFERQTVEQLDGRLTLEIEYGPKDRIKKESTYKLDKNKEFVSATVDNYDPALDGKVRISRETRGKNGCQKDEFDASGNRISTTTFQYDNETGQYLGYLKRCADNSTERAVMRMRNPSDIVQSVESITKTRADGSIEFRKEFDSGGRSYTHTVNHEDGSSSVVEFELGCRTNEFRKSSEKLIRNGIVKSITRYAYNDMVLGLNGHWLSKLEAITKTMFDTAERVSREQECYLDGKVCTERRYALDPNSDPSAKVLHSTADFDREGNVKSLTVFAKDGKTKIYQRWITNSGVSILTNTPDGKNKTIIVRDGTGPDAKITGETVYHQDGKTVARYAYYSQGFKCYETAYAPDGKELYKIDHRDLPKSLESQEGKIPQEARLRLIKETVEKLLSTPNGSFHRVYRDQELRGVEVIAKGLKDLSPEQSARIRDLLRTATYVLPSDEVRATDAAKVVRSLEVAAALARFATPEEVRRVANFADRQALYALNASHVGPSKDIQNHSTELVKASGLVLTNVMAYAQDPQARQAAFDRFCKDRITFDQYGKLPEKLVQEALTKFLEKCGADLTNWKVLAGSGHTAGLPLPVAYIFKSIGVGGSDLELAKLAESAVKNNGGEQAVRKVFANAALFNALPESLRIGLVESLISTMDGKEVSKNAELLKAQGTAVDLRQLAVQLANGTLQESSNWILRQDIGKKLSESAATYSEAVKKSEEHLQQLQLTMNMKLKELGFPKTVSWIGYLGSTLSLEKLGLAAERDVVERLQAQDLLNLQRQQESIYRKATEVALLKSCVEHIQLSLDAGEEARLRASGKVQEADKKALELWRKYGDALRDRVPELWTELRGIGGAKDCSAVESSAEARKLVWDRLRELGLVVGNGACSQTLGTHDSYKAALEALSKLSGSAAEKEVVKREALRAIDSCPRMVEINNHARVIGENLAKFQALILAAQGGHTSKATLSEVHALAGKLQMAFDLAKVNLDEFKSVKDELRRAGDRAGKDGDYELWLTLDRRADALEQMINMLDPHFAARTGAKVDQYGQIKHMLDSVWNGELKESNLATWLATEGTVITGAILVCAALTATVATSGVMAPAAIGAIGLFVGSEGAKEIQHRYGGIIPESERSLLGAYCSKVKVYNPETGRSRQREFWWDTAIPALSHIGADFAIMLVTAGVGAEIGEALGSVLAKAGMKQLPRIVQENAAEFQKLARQIEIVEKLAENDAQKAIVKEILQKGMSKFREGLVHQVVGTVELEVAQRVAADLVPRTTAATGQALSIGVMCVLAAKSHIKTKILGDIHGVVLSGDNGKPLSEKELLLFKRVLEVQGQRVGMREGTLEVIAPDGTKVFMGSEVGVKAALIAQEKAAKQAEASKAAESAIWNVREPGADAGRKLTSAPESNNDTTGDAKPDFDFALSNKRLRIKEGEQVRVGVSGETATPREGSVIVGRDSKGLYIQDDGNNRLWVRAVDGGVYRELRHGERVFLSADGEVRLGGPQGPRLLGRGIELYVPDRRLTRLPQGEIHELIGQLVGQTGILFKPELIEALSKELTHLSTSWSASLSASSRAAQLQECLNKFADHYGLPRVEVIAVKDLPGVQAQYYDGRIWIRESALVDGNNVAKLVEKEYHEFVHNEQDATIIRSLADELRIFRLTGIETNDKLEIEALRKLYEERTGMDLSDGHAREVLNVRNGQPLTAAERTRAVTLAQQFKANSPVSGQMWHETDRQFKVASSELGSLSSTRQSEAAGALLDRLANDKNGSLSRDLFGADKVPAEVVQLLIEKKAYDKKLGGSWDDKRAAEVLEKLLYSRLETLNSTREAGYHQYMNGPEKEPWVAGQRARLFALGEGATETKAHQSSDESAARTRGNVGADRKALNILSDQATARAQVKPVEELKPLLDDIRNSLKKAGSVPHDVKTKAFNLFKERLDKSVAARDITELELKMIRNYLQEISQEPKFIFDKLETFTRQLAEPKTFLDRLQVLCSINEHPVMRQSGIKMPVELLGDEIVTTRQLFELREILSKDAPKDSSQYVIEPLERLREATSSTGNDVASALERFRLEMQNLRSMERVKDDLPDGKEELAKRIFEATSQWALTPEEASTIWKGLESFPKERLQKHLEAVLSVSDHAVICGSGVKMTPETLKVLFGSSDVPLINLIRLKEFFDSPAAREPAISGVIMDNLSSLSTEKPERLKKICEYVDWILLHAETGSGGIVAITDEVKRDSHPLIRQALAAVVGKDLAGNISTGHLDKDSLARIFSEAKNISVGNDRKSPGNSDGKQLELSDAVKEEIVRSLRHEFGTTLNPFNLNPEQVKNLKVMMADRDCGSFLHDVLSQSILIELNGNRSLSLNQISNMKKIIRELELDKKIASGQRPLSVEVGVYRPESATSVSQVINHGDSPEQVKAVLKARLGLEVEHLRTNEYGVNSFSYTDNENRLNIVLVKFVPRSEAMPSGVVEVRVIESKGLIGPALNDLGLEAKGQFLDHITERLSLDLILQLTSGQAPSYSPFLKNLKDAKYKGFQMYEIRFPAKYRTYMVFRRGPDRGIEALVIGRSLDAGEQKRIIRKLKD